jgi:O-antigen/teichoic acid export membrane protein
MSAIEAVLRAPPLVVSRLHSLRRWGRPVALGILEQAIYSGTNLVFTVLLLKMIGAREFGTFNIAWSVVMLAECLLYSLFGDAMPAIANRLPLRLWPQLRAAVYLWSAVFSFVVFAAAAVSAAVLLFVAPAQAGLVAMTGLAIFTMRAQQMGRRICYLDGTRNWAVAGAVLSCVTTFAGLALAWNSGARNGGAAMACLALGCAASASVLIFRRSAFRWPERRLLIWSWRRFWRAGRPLTAASLSYWMANTGLIPVAAAMLGREAAGLLRIVQTFTNPLAQLTSIMISVALPPAAERLRSPTRAMFVRVSMRSVALFAAIAVAYSLLLILYGPPLVHLLFHGKLDGVGRAVLVVASLAATLDMIASALGVPLLAIGRTAAILHGRIAALVALSVIMPVALHYPALAVFVAVTAASNFAQTVVLALSQSRQFHALPLRELPSHTYPGEK